MAFLFNIYSVRYINKYNQFINESIENPIDLFQELIDDGYRIVEQRDFSGIFHYYHLMGDPKLIDVETILLIKQRFEEEGYICKVLNYTGHKFIKVPMDINILLTDRKLFNRLKNRVKDIDLDKFEFKYNGTHQQIFYENGDKYFSLIDLNTLLSEEGTDSNLKPLGRFAFQHKLNYEYASSENPDPDKTALLDLAKFNLIEFILKDKKLI